MRCEACVLEQTGADAAPLEDFLEQLAACDECPLLVGEAATPLVRRLVLRHREAARAVRGLGNQARKLKFELAETEKEAEKYEEQIALLERLQKTSTAETEDELRGQLALLKRQREEMRAMSAPIIRAGKGVLVLPLFGAVDAERAKGVTDRLLDAVDQGRSSHAIVDLTGIDAVDVETAGHLLRMVRAVRLLGATVILTGIRGRVAQALVGLGVDLSSVTTLSSVEEALRQIV